MKKHFLIITFLILSITLGCSFQEDKEAVPQEQELKLEKYSGELVKSENAELKTSFALKTLEGNEIPVKSGLFNLKKYEKRKIEIEGKMQENNVFEISSLIRLGKEEETKETYKNAFLGFTLQYPSPFKIIEKENMVFFMPYEAPEDEIMDKIAVAKLSNEKKYDLKKWLSLDENLIPQDPEDDSFYSEVLIGVDQLPGIKKTGRDGSRIDFYLARESSVYRITWITIKDEDVDMYRRIFFDIVNSFKFIGQKDAEEIESAEEKKPETEAPEEEPAPTPSPASDSLENLVNYLKENITTLAPKPPSNEKWFVDWIELVADSNLVYVIYEDGHYLQKVLLKLDSIENPASAEVAAYFEPGEKTDWTLEQGQDLGRSKARTLINVEGDKISEKVEIKEGFRLMETSRLKVKIQYPASWYYAARMGGISFGPKPIESEPDSIIHFTRQNADQSGLMAESFTACKQSKSNDYLCFSGYEDYKEVIRKMIELVQEL